MKYTKQILSEAVAKSSCMSDVLRNLGLKIAGGTFCHIKRKIEKFGISTEHFLSLSDLAIKQNLVTKKTWKEILIKRNQDYKESSSRLKRAMIEYGFDYRCKKCHLEDEWFGEKIILEIDHIDGDSFNNQPQNLRFLCPNCHSQTSTFCRRK